MMGWASLGKRGGKRISGSGVAGIVGLKEVSEYHAINLNIRRQGSIIRSLP